jgi:hypothetical protein
MRLWVIIDLGIRRSGQFHTRSALNPSKEPMVYPLDRRLDGTQICCGRSEQKNSVSTGNRIPAM